MTNRQLFQQVRVLDPLSGTDRIADVLIADGVIEAIEDKIYHWPENTSVRDCWGLILGPGLVDLYSHSGEPGFEERETLISLSQAAAAGGFTRLAILPDTTPAIDNPAALARLQKLHPSLSPAPLLHFWGAFTLSAKGEEMTELAELASAGVVGFADGQPIANLGLVRRLLEYLQPLEKPVALWCCDRQLAGNGVMREGSHSILYGLPGNPAISETAAIAALLELVAAIGTPVHIMRVSTARGVELIQQAKQRGLPITASTTWMHLLLDTEAVISYNTSLRIAPPLGNPSDRVALRRGVKEGILEAIAIDHTPYSYEEKTVAFAEAPPGAIGLELALPLLWENLVETGEFSAIELWRALSTQPAECSKQIPARVAPNQPAEITLFDPKSTWTVDRTTLKTLSSNTPWFGQQLKGRVLLTVNR
jgi:dihydroorotase